MANLNVRLCWLPVVALLLTAPQLSSAENVGDAGCSITEDPDHHVDVFHLILSHLNASGNTSSDNETLSPQQVGQAIAEILGRFTCNHTDDGRTIECPQVLCFDIDGLLNLTDTDTTPGLSEEEFQNTSTVITYFLFNIPKNCHRNIVLNQTLAYYKQELVKTLTGSASSVVIDTDDTEHALEGLENLYEHSEIDHDGDGDHADEEHGDHEEEKHGDHADEEHGDHADEEHGDHADEEHGDHADEEHGDHEDEEHGDHADEEHGDHEEEEHGDHDHAHLHAEVRKDKCFGADVIWDDLGLDPSIPVTMETLPQLAILFLYNFLIGSEISDGCRLLPRPTYFLDELFAHRATMTETELEEVVNQVLHHGEGGHADEENHDDHDHRRRRRDADEGHHETDERWHKCYSSEEMLGIYGVGEGGAITRATFTALCPGLVQTKLSGACEPGTNPTAATKDTVSDAKRFGYGTLATVIVCLCSLFGAAVVPLASRRAFRVFLSVFRGLAVGTLVGDSFLHLIPVALGVHGHAEGSEGSHDHNHGDGFVLEDFVGFALATMGGIYVFFLLELVMGLAGHSSASIERESSEDQSTEVSYGMAPAKGSDNLSFNPNPKSAVYQVENVGEPTAYTKPVKAKKVSATVLMVIIGDGLHNFVDGLALGTSFSVSLTTGLATSITIFCHELPHEVGDFAILITNGISIKMALLWNLISSLTALVGLYVGLVVSTDYRTNQWIFAVTAGFFIYIALVNVVPNVIRNMVKSKERAMAILSGNLGILLGFAIMFVIAVFEEKIKL